MLSTAVPTRDYLLKGSCTESSVDDLGTCRGVVLSRAATILRSIETLPSTGRFVRFDEQPSFSFILHVPSVYVTDRVDWQMSFCQPLSIYLPHTDICLRPVVTICDYGKCYLSMSYSFTLHLCYMCLYLSCCSYGFRPNSPAKVPVKSY
jgi:hypothetical protein